MAHSCGWTFRLQERGGPGGRRPDSSKKPPVNTKPSKTLFVINFDHINTRTRDIERHFEIYGKISNVRIRRNFAFVHFEVQEDATRALEATDSSKLLDRVISVEYAIRVMTMTKETGTVPIEEDETSPLMEETMGDILLAHIIGRGAAHIMDVGPAQIPELSEEEEARQ